MRILRENLLILCFHSLNFYVFSAQAPGKTFSLPRPGLDWDSSPGRSLVGGRMQEAKRVKCLLWLRLDSRKFCTVSQGSKLRFSQKYEKWIFCRPTIRSGYSGCASRAVASGGGSGARPPHLKSVPPPFHVWPTGCCIHPILYFKMCPPPFGFWPPCCYILATGLCARCAHKSNWSWLDLFAVRVD